MSHTAGRSRHDYQRPPIHLVDACTSENPAVDDGEIEIDDGEDVTTVNDLPRFFLSCTQATPRRSIPYLLIISRVNFKTIVAGQSNPTSYPSNTTPLPPPLSQLPKTMFSLLTRRLPLASPRLFSSFPQPQIQQQINIPLLASLLNSLEITETLEAGNRNARRPKKANRGSRPVSNAGRRAKRRDHGKWKR